MDALGISRGLARYRVELDHGPAAGVLAFAEVRDRAWVILDGAPIGVLAREDHAWAITLPRGEGVLELLVEDQGRVNYGPRIGEPKGLIGPATFAGAALAGWNASPVPLEGFEDGSALLAPPDSAMTAGAQVFQAAVLLDGPTDLALSTDGWGKGLVWVNGFCLGRYWRSGPQRTLFVPGPVTRAGENVVTLLEFEALSEGTVRFVPDLDLGHTEF